MLPQAIPTTPTQPPAAECQRRQDLECRLAKLADAGPHAINDRIDQLEWEWTAGRMTKVTLGVTILVGFALTALLNPWFLVLPAAAGLFLLQYIFSRSSWLGEMFHEMGYRRGCEVEQEKLALRALRGDFRHLPTLHDIESADDISRLEGEGGIVVEVEAQKIDPREAVKEVVHAAKQ